MIPKSDQPPVILERGPDHRVVEWYSQISDESGTPLTLTNRYTEVATGLHFLDARGEWQDSVAAFEAVSNGWVAARGPHQVALSTDISVPGSVTVVTSDGVTLRSTPTLLAFVDRATGQEVRLADLQSSRGELIATGTVLYANAFDSVSADVRAVYTPAGFECDVIVRAALPSPAEFGLNPDTTDLAVFTEFFETQPTDVKEFEVPLSERESSADTLLGFGSMRMDRGKAFVLPGDAGRELRVRKSWEQREGRTFLLERTDWRELEPWLRELPEARVNTPEAQRRLERSRRTVSLEIPIRTGTRPEWPRSTGGRLMAGQGTRARGDVVLRADSGERGIVLDYTLVGTSTNITFSSLATYLVTGPAYLSQSATFQPGTVVKYSATNSPFLYLVSGTTLNWQGAPYRPVVLTAYDDNSVGEFLPNATGSPSGTYASSALTLEGDLAGATSITNFSIRHATRGMEAIFFGYLNSAKLTLRHGQFVNCLKAMVFQAGNETNESYQVQNVLVTSSFTNSVAFADPYVARVAGHFVTATGLAYLRQSSVTPDYSTVGLTHSIIYNVGDVSGVSRTLSPIATANPFVAVGAGGHYLNLFDGDTINEDILGTVIGANPALGPADLATELGRSTVLPPLPLPAAVMANTAVSREGILDRNNTTNNWPNYVGYHYWPVHFLASNVLLTNATLTLSNRTRNSTEPLVLAGSGASAVQLASGSRFASVGQPQALNRLCWSSAVQELPSGGAPSGSRSFWSIPTGSSIWPEIRIRLSQAEFDGAPYARRGLFDLNASGRNMALAELKDSQFKGVWINFAPVDSGSQTLILKNCVFEDSRVEAYKNYSGSPSVVVQQNLVRNGTFILYHYLLEPGLPPWTCTDNFFATSGASAYSMATNRLYAGWNGYTGSSAVFSGSGNKVSVALNWVTGPLGGWYYPTTGVTNGLTNLLSAGSQLSTNAGLYHYTTRVDQTKEGSKQVDIGFHYVAATNQFAVNTDIDQIPDYVEDVNGNGLIDSGEVAWNNVDADEDGLWDPDELGYATLLNSGSSDSDGLTDKSELFQGTNPRDTTNSVPKLLGDWRFNATGVLTNQQGVAPLNGANVPLVSSYEGLAPAFGSSVTNVLRYPLSSGTNPVLDLTWGTLSFTYVPDWYYGSPTNQPGQWCRLIECGPWQLSISPDGKYIVFESPAADGTVTRNFTGRLPRVNSPTTLRTGWEIELEWCRAYCRMSINQSPLTDEYTQSAFGAGVTTLPSNSALTSGFCLGSAANGSAGARGYLDQLTTYNAVMYQSFAATNLRSAETIFKQIAIPPNQRKVEITATPVTSPDGLELRWNRGWEGDPAANAGKYSVQRREWGTATWTNIADNVFADVWRDNTAQAGNYYEYRVTRNFPTNLWPSTWASLRGAPIENRGTAILLVDQTLATDLATQIDTFKLDLVADGWKVVSANAHRHTNFSSTGVPDANYIANLQSNKSFIRTQWQANPNGTNVVILLGHVTVPYSGLVAEDGHVENHRGSWPADVWYGDMDADTNWTDTATGGVDFQKNLPSDGKWDQNALPGNGRLEIPVGRIDFYNLPIFKNKVLANGASTDSEVERELIKNYLAKDAAYRRGQLGPYLSSSTCFVWDSRFWELFKSQARVSSWLMGQMPPFAGIGIDLFTQTNQAKLFGFHGGDGSFSSVLGASGVLVRSVDIANQTNKPNAAFLFLRGSYFGNWNYHVSPDAFLRACLTPPDAGLAAFWVGPRASDFEAAGPWLTSVLGVGDSLGGVLLETMNGPVKQSSRVAFLLGDPTLRAINAAAVTNLTCIKNGSSAILTWAWSATPGATYHVYRAGTSLSDSWLRITTTALTTNTFTNTPPANGTYHYVVKALAAEATAVGSFTRVSQGTRTSITIP